MDKEKLIGMIGEYLFVSDEWGGSKLANWQWGHNVVIDGIDDFADAVFEEISQQAGEANEKKPCWECDYFKNQGANFCHRCGVDFRTA